MQVAALPWWSWLMSEEAPSWWLAMVLMVVRLCITSNFGGWPIHVPATSGRSGLYLVPGGRKCLPALRDIASVPPVLRRFFTAAGQPRRLLLLPYGRLSPQTEQEITGVAGRTRRLFQNWNFNWIHADWGILLAVHPTQKVLLYHDIDVWRRTISTSYFNEKWKSTKPQRWVVNSIYTDYLFPQGVMCCSSCLTWFLLPLFAIDFMSSDLDWIHILSEAYKASSLYIFPEDHS